MYKDILEEIAGIVGLYEKVFGKLLDYLVFDQNFENQKHLLKNIFQYWDTETIFIKQIERKQFQKISKIVFRFNPDKDTPKPIFGKNDKE